MTAKKVIGKLHLWLGLTSGLVVFVVAITGCLYAFQAEIQELTQPYRHIERKDRPLLSPSELKEIATKELPGKKVHSALYEQGNRSAVVSFYDFDPLYYYLVYIDPFNGTVLKVKNMSHDFFYQVLQGHFYLWLPPAVGQPVVAMATLVFVVMLITGIVLWWPKKNKAKQRFTIKWGAKWRRKNYDLHNVLGFYTMWIALILALTGLIWGFEWFANSVYQLAGGDKNIIYKEPLSIKSDNFITNPVDKLWVQLKKENPRVDILELHFPASDTASLSVTINPDRKTYWKSDYRFFDQYTLKELSSNQVYGKLSHASAADKLMRMNYDIHTGAILGLPGKVLAFFASLICASLPITGFCIWYGRNYKKAKKGKATEAKAFRPKVEPAGINN
jgi:uncharacterized iron-regulated membrane protein